MGTELVYREVSCSKSVGGNDFQSGVQDYNFSTSSPTAWYANKSYFRITLTVAGQAAVPTQGEQIALADSVCGNLYDNCIFRGSGQDISSAMNYVAQASALKMRLSKTTSWINSVGKSAYGFESNFQSNARTR